jgi:ribose transport system substrate-binding protein
LSVAIAVAACGSSDSGSSTSTTESTEASGGGDETAGGSPAAAEKVIAPYVGQPSPFPVTESLKEVPKGATIAYMDCGTGICGLFWELLQGASQTMGVKMTRIKAGSAANTVTAAFDSVVAQKPDAVIVTAINVELWSKQLKELQEADIPVVTTGITDTEEYGIESPQASNASSELAGHLMANYVVAKMSPEANIVMYEVPELPFSVITAEAFAEELGKVCPECSVRTVPIPVATTGNTAPSTIVSDLQANPETTIAAFSSDETELGLPAALKAAGIEVETLGYSPAPPNLQYVKEGTETAVLAFDLPVLTWTLIDQAAREITGQELTGPQAEGIPVNQFLTQEDIVFDPAKGWTGYPDFAERFAKLWGVGG